MNNAHRLQPTDLRKFILAGNATFTVQNLETGNRFTFKVELSKKSDFAPLWFVSVLTGPDNTSDFSYLGTIRFLDERREMHHAQYRYGWKSRIALSAPSAIVFEWFWARLDHLPAKVEVTHVGKCGRCGRALTVPESVKSGLGPECMKAVA